VKATIQPSRLNGHVLAPASKSVMQRACAAALLKKGNTIIRNPGHSNDDKAALDIIRRLGATAEWLNGEWHITSQGIRPVSDILNCGESGLSIRMFTPIAALSNKRLTITGHGSLLERPMDLFDQLLPTLGVRVESRGGKPPLHIQGPLRPANIEIDGSISSQFLTGLLMAYGAVNATNVSISVNGLKSKPYVDLTLGIMKYFGFKRPINEGYNHFLFDGNNTYANSDLPQRKENANLGPTEFTVESDWSSGAFLLVAGLIAGPIMVSGLDLTSVQGDRKIMDVLLSANASLAVEAKGIKVRPSPLRPFEFDANDCPDLFPPLAALAAYCKGRSVIRGVGRLAHKESDRARSLSLELSRMGIKLEIEDDSMVIEGGQPVRGSAVSAHHDHRIVMACAVAALGAENDTVIEEAEAVNKSYPDFFDDLKKLGANVSLDNKIKLA
jgi:3-phosphoshikimate 1-carboxyvinyltransferase